MRRSKARLPLACVLALLAPPGPGAASDPAATAEAKLLRIYSAFYGFSPEEVFPIERKRPAETAVILELARSAKMRPGEVLELREQGMGIYAITRRLQQSVDIFFVPLPPAADDKMQPLYQTAWRTWRRYQKGWPEEPVLSDDELILVNHVKLHALYFKKDAAKVIQRFEREGAPRDILLRALDDQEFKKRR